MKIGRADVDDGADVIVTGKFVPLVILSPALWLRLYCLVGRPILRHWARAVGRICRGGDYQVKWEFRPADWSTAKSVMEEAN